MLLRLAGLQGELLQHPGVDPTAMPSRIRFRRFEDLGPTCREMFQQLRGEAADVGDPVHDRSPRHTEPSGELVPQHRLIDGAACLCVQVVASGFQGSPAVFGVNPVDHNHMGMKLRVVGPRCEVVECCGYPSFRVDVPRGLLPLVVFVPPAGHLPGLRAVFLHVLHRLAHGF